MQYLICWIHIFLAITVFLLTATRKELPGKAWLISALGVLFFSYFYMQCGWILYCIGIDVYDFRPFIDPYLYYIGYVLLLKYVVVATPRKEPDSMTWLDCQFANTRPLALLLACIIGWWFMIPFSLVGMILCRHPKAIKRASLIFIVQISLILAASFIVYARGL